MASNKSPKPLVADTSPTKKIFIQGITKDLDNKACIFDLIDNAIDAAQQFLPVANRDYKNYQIIINFNENLFSIRDYGSGISQQKILNYALKFGASDQNRIGIGVFGIGLNRAIFKLGSTIKISTETESERTIVNLNIEKYSLDDNWYIPVQKDALTNSTGTLIEVSNLFTGVAAELGDFNWAEELRSEVSQRYSRFILKGLKIFINDQLVAANHIQIRNEGYFKVKNKKLTIDQISVDIRLGQHLKHRFTDEQGYDKKINESIAGEYGWTIYCNDRAVLIADTSSQSGWDTSYHSQYYGFVGEAHFIGDSSLLPWNTNKTGVDLNNLIYSQAIAFMRSFSGEWRSHTDKVKKGSNKLLNQNASLDLGIGNTASNNDSTDIIANPADLGDADLPDTAKNNLRYNSSQHPLKTKYLFGESISARLDFNVPVEQVKLVAVIKEIRSLELVDYQFAVSLLLRVLIEESCRYYRKSNSNKPDINNNESLAATVKKCKDSMVENGILTDFNEIKSIDSICNQTDIKVISINYIQNSIHSSKSILSKDGILAFWHDIHPFIRGCFRT